MDPLGGAASIVTLIDIAIKGYKLAKDVVGRYRRAAAEFQTLRHQLDGLYSQLILLQQLQLGVNRDDLLFPTIDVEHLRRFLEDTTALFTDMYRMLEKQTLGSGKSSRVKWAIHDSAKVKRWEAELRSHSETLANLLLLLNVRYISLLHTNVRKLKMAETSTSQLNKKLHYVRSRNTFGSQLLIPCVARLDGSITSLTDQEQQEIYRIALRFRSLFSPKTVCIDALICRTSLLTFRMVPLRNTGLSMKHVVPYNSPIMAACSRGEVTTVWELLNTKKASVNDITPDNFPPLRYAIESGSLELVSFLLNNGADARASFGRFQTSPLGCAFTLRKLDIARLLLEKGADPDYISAKGWAPSFSLFDINLLHQSPCEEYFEMLSAISPISFDAQDSEGWSVMHRAAAYGTAEHVETLVRWHSPLINLHTRRTCWTPIFCAVQSGNVGAFNELRKYIPDLRELRDVRGWSLLHVAINAQRMDTTKLLIDLGADPHAKSIPTESCVPPQLKGLVVTPGDIAGIKELPILDAFVNALVQAGYDDIVIRGDEEHDSHDMFWDAKDVFQ